MRLSTLFLIYFVLLYGVSVAALTQSHNAEKEVVRLQSELRVAKEQAAHCTKMEAYCQTRAPFTQLTYWCEEPRVKEEEKR